MLATRFDRESLLAQMQAAASGDPDWTGLGTPLIDPDGRSDTAIGMLTRRSLERALPPAGIWRNVLNDAAADLSTRTKRDAAVARAVGEGTRRVRPWEGLCPADLAQLRALLLNAMAFNSARFSGMAPEGGGGMVHAAVAAGTGLLIADAVPVFISGGAGALMTSDPPDEVLAANVRLPFPSVLCFFDAVPLDDLELDNELLDGPTCQPVHGHRSLVGVVLYANHDGVGLAQDVTWLLTAPGRDTHGVVAINGLWEHSAQPAVVMNLAATCTWATRRNPPLTPPQLTGEPDSREWRRALQRSAVRKAIARGAALNVNIIDLCAQHATGDAPAANTGRTVRSHWRRGYWNRVRVATRDDTGAIIGDRFGDAGVDWHYEGRWIHPLLVRGHQHEPAAITVYTAASTAR